MVCRVQKRVCGVTGTHGRGVDSGSDFDQREMETSVGDFKSSNAVYELAIMHGG
jgi:hypothetical protein